MFTPTQRLFAAALVTLLASIAVVWLAIAQPWVGVTFAFDPSQAAAVAAQTKGPSAAVPAGAAITGIAGGGDSLTLEAGDFTAEPDGMASFDEYEAFLDRQDRLAAIQASDAVTLTGADGESWTVSPAPRRPLADLPAAFWVQLFVAVFAWLISACIWAFRPGSPAARYLLLSGLATLTFASLAGIYSTRELALPEGLFRWLNDLNFLGGTVFSAALLALMLHYPRRLAPAWVGVAVTLFYLAWWVAQQLGAFESMVIARRIHVLAALVAVFILSGVHWRATRADPVARAALQWFLLSWLVGVTAFAVGILLPQLFGVDTAPYQGYAFTLFLLIYAGLAFGIARFRLFDLGVWWMRTVVWTITVAILVGLDLIFAAGLQLSGAASLSLALLVCGLVWLPLRAWLWGRFFPMARPGDRAVFDSVVGIGFAADPEQQTERWRDLLSQMFGPLHIVPAPEGPATPRLEEDGLAMIAPAVDPLPAIRLEYAHGGRRLFTSADLQAAEEVAGMLRHVFESRRAHERGVAQERKRIASDIHDNVGARLMTAMRTSGDDAKNSRIRETLVDLGRITNDVYSRSGPLDEALADLRMETAERLEAEGVTLDWPIGQTPPVALSGAAAHALRSIIREAVTNALKHARPGRIAVVMRYDSGVLLVSVEDDGPGFDPAAAAGGAGLATMRARAEARGGTVAWSQGTAGRGARLVVNLPLADAAPAE